MSDNYGDLLYIFGIFLVTSGMGAINLHSSLTHLSQTEVQDLISDYLGGQKTSALLEKYRINCAPNQLRNILPPRLAGSVCSRCGKFMVLEYPRRHRKNGQKDTIRCIECLHEEGDHCTCMHCITLRNETIMKERADKVTKLADAIKKENINRQIERSDDYITKLPLSIALSFLSLIRCCPINADGMCGPLSSSTVPIAPYGQWKIELLNSLYESGLILLSAKFIDGCIHLTEDGITFDSEHVIWEIAPNTAKQLIERIELAGLTGIWPAHWQKEVHSLWLNLAHAECREFYDYCSKLRGLQPHSNLAINSMLMNLLRDYSVAQCFRIIWHGARSTGDFLARRAISKPHAANYMIGACQRWADRARTEGWNVSPFKRNFYLPRSMFSYVLFDVILKIGERGFTNAVGSIE